MRAPAPTPGMGSLLTEEGCRFRVWAPNAKRLQVVGDFSPTPIDLAPDPGTGTWSVDQVPPNPMTATDTSSPIVEVKTTTTRNCGTAPTPVPSKSDPLPPRPAAILFRPFPQIALPSIPHLSTNSSFTSSMSARSRATMTAPMSATIPLPSSISSPNSTTYVTLASMPSNSYQLTPSKAAPAEQASYMAPLISTLSPTSTPPIPPKLSPNSSN